MLGRTETRTRDRIYCQTMRTVREISRDDRARIATCRLRTHTDRLKANCSIDYCHPLSHPGLVDILREPEYKDIGETMQVPKKDAEFFASHVDQISLRITVFQHRILQHGNLFRLDADWLVSSVVDTNGELKDHEMYERLNKLLQNQENIIRSESDNA